MNMLFWIAALATGLLMPAAKAKADYEVMTRKDIFFAEHDGVKLLGDFYAPKGLLPLSDIDVTACVQRMLRRPPSPLANVDVR